MSRFTVQEREELLALINAARKASWESARALYAPVNGPRLAEVAAAHEVDMAAFEAVVRWVLLAESDREGVAA